MTNKKKYEEEFDKEKEDFGGTYKLSRDPFFKEELINRAIHKDEDYNDKKRNEEALWDKPLGGRLED